MFNKKPIIAITSGAILTIALSATSISFASNDAAITPLENSSFILAQASQQGTEKGHKQGGGMRDGEGHGESGKHRHGQDRDSEHGGGGHGGGGHGGGGHGGGGHGGGGHGGGGHGGGAHDDGHGEHDDDHENGNKKNSDMKKGKHDYAHMLIKHADVLKLTDEQLGKITRLHLKHKKTHEEVKEALQESMKAFKKGSMNPATNDDQVRKLGKDATAAFNKMVEYHIKERDAVHSILSDDQKKQLNTLKMDHDSHDSDKGGHGAGGHSGH